MDGDGLTITHRQAAWDWVDRTIVTAYLRLLDSRCPNCGRPWAAHKDDRVEDYHVGFVTCTATEALDRIRATWSKQPGSPLAGDREAHKRGRNPDAARSWLTWTDAEGAPSFD